MIKHRRRMTSMTREETLENKMKSMNFSMRNGNKPMRMMMKRQKAVKSTSRKYEAGEAHDAVVEYPHG